jgi:hypothetical protein
MTALDGEGVRQRYERALDALVAVLRQDRTVLAAILFGSLSYDEVWDRSDIDLLIVGDETHKARSVSLTEEGVNIHAQVMPRSVFKKAVEGGLQGSFFHSMVSRSRLLYSADESLAGLYEDLHKVGARDREVQLLRVASGALLPVLTKAEKWFHVKRDYRYAAVWLLIAVTDLARIEVVAAGEIPGREVIQQALRLNPAFFTRVYMDLLDGPKDEANVGGAIEAVNAYLTERIPVLFRPLFRYLAEAGGPRSVTEITEHFRKLLQGDGVDAACEWLADRGVIEKVGTPLRLSDKSRVAVNEAAYYYDGED